MVLPRRLILLSSVTFGRTSYNLVNTCALCAVMIAMLCKECVFCALLFTCAYDSDTLGSKYIISVAVNAGRFLTGPLNRYICLPLVLVIVSWVTRAPRLLISGTWPELEKIIQALGNKKICKADACNTWRSRAYYWLKHTVR